MKFLYMLICVVFLCAGQSAALHAQTLDQQISSTTQYDTTFWQTAVEFHGSLPVPAFAELLKATALTESGLRPGVSRDERGYLSGKYAKQVAIDASRLRTYAIKNYGVDQSLYTWKIDLSKSYGLMQIMGEKAYELGWRGYSLLDPETGLLNPKLQIYYGAKLMHNNLARYGFDIRKAISAYNAGSYTERNRVYIETVLKNLTRVHGQFDHFQLQ